MEGSFKFPGKCCALSLLCLLGYVHWSQADLFDHWTVNHLSATRGMFCVTYGNGLFVAAGGSSDFGAVYTSSDGKDWTFRTDGGFPNFTGLGWVRAITYGAGRFVTVSLFGGTGVSTNGIDWVVVPGSSGRYGVAYNTGGFYANGLFVAVGLPVGNDDRNVYTSRDGINWVAQHSGSPPGQTLLDVTALNLGPYAFFAIGGSSPVRVYGSSNGTNWTSGPIAGGKTISALKNTFIVPFGPRTNLVNGTTPVYTGVDAEFGKINFANGVYVARAGSSLVTSTNGSDWTIQSQVLPGSSDVTTDGKRLVTVGFSPNGGPTPGSADGYAFVSDLMVDVQMTNANPAQIVISGLVGRSYRIEYAEGMAGGSNVWQTLTNLQLPTSPCVITDVTASNSPSRFYRGVLLP